MRKPRIIHPILLAIYPVLHLYYYNRDQLPLSVIFVPSLVLAGIAVILWAGLRLLLRNGAKAGLLTSLLLVWFFSYGHVFTEWSWIRQRYLLSGWTLLLILGVYAIVKTRRDTLPFQKVMNVIAGVLVAFILVNIGIYELGSRQQDGTQADNARPPLINPAAAVTPAAFQAESRPPNIYYIVLDSYAGAPILKKYFQYDNDWFLQDLRQRGFYVAAHSHSNYPFTLTSIPSSLNLDYLTDLARQVGPNSRNFRLIMERIRNNEAQRFLHTQGYDYLTIDAPDKVWGIEFWDLLVRTSVLFSIGPGGYGWRREKTLAAFQQVESVANSARPTFVYAHIYCPHAPFVFRPNGEMVRTTYRQQLHLVTHDEIRQLYADQVAYISKRTEAMIDTLLAKSPVPPIIVIQADHGPRDLVPPWNPTDECIEQYFPILNAYYLPHNGASRLYDSISPVNSFRVIFNKYFGTHLPLLKDESYFCTYQAPFRYLDVTSRLHDLETKHSAVEKQQAWAHPTTP